MKDVIHIMLLVFFQIYTTENIRKTTSEALFDIDFLELVPTWIRFVFENTSKKLVFFKSV